MHSWQRGPKPSFLWRPPILPTAPFSNFDQHTSPPLPFRLQLPPLTALYVVLFIWLYEWLCHIWCAILLNDIIDLHMSSLGTLAPERPSCVFYATRHHVYWGLTNNVVFRWYPNLISHKHTHTYTRKDTQYTLGPVDWHIHINIYLHHLLCAHNSYLYQKLISDILISKIYFPQCFTFQNLFISKSHISVDKMML